MIHVVFLCYFGGFFALSCIAGGLVMLVVEKYRRRMMSREVDDEPALIEGGIARAFIERKHGFRLPNSLDPRGKRPVSCSPRSISHFRRVKNPSVTPRAVLAPGSR
jgi:hypothetical protein